MPSLLHLVQWDGTASSMLMSHWLKFDGNSCISYARFAAAAIGSSRAEVCWPSLKIETSRHGHGVSIVDDAPWIEQRKCKRIRHEPALQDSP
mmetsp:Transcript_54498/g.119306  ORF Transcript_54498/g.119306 Transcript_54498/m.119306 type:complete len:92 (-) Transcript_54498:391-666(-)